MEMLRKFLLVGVMVLVNPGTIQQISMGTIFCATYLIVQLKAAPYHHRTNGFLADASSFSLLMFYFCCTVYKFDALTSSSLQDFMSGEQQRNYITPGATFSVVLVLSVLGSLLFAAMLVAIQAAAEVRRMLKRPTRADMIIPTCQWYMKPGQDYSCFLSHYKAEAGAEARYIKDSLDKMLNCPAYLDSSSLADLRELFRTGMRRSEVLVLLLSDNLFTRPWCLLEIREAMRLRKPIILLELKGPGQSFNFDAAFELMSDLESNLPRLNPSAIGELHDHLNGEPLSELQRTVRKALNMGRAAGVSRLNINGTANQLEADLLDLVDSLALATGRTVKWKGGRLFVDKPLLAKQRKQRVSDYAKKARFSGRSASDVPGTYIIHEPAAEAHAVRLQEGMADTYVQSCNIEIPNSREEMEKCLSRVAQSTCVVLLQTRSVLQQPWALLAVFHATLANVPVVCVVVTESGYDFRDAKLHLEHLREHLDAPVLEQISGELSRWEPPKDAEELQSTLARLIPQIISVSYHADGSRNELIATIRDVEDKQSLLQVGWRPAAFTRQAPLVPVRTAAAATSAAITLQSHARRKQLVSPATERPTLRTTQQSKPVAAAPAATSAAITLQSHARRKKVAPATERPTLPTTQPPKSALAPAAVAPPAVAPPAVAPPAVAHPAVAPPAVAAPAVAAAPMAVNVPMAQAQVVADSDASRMRAEDERGDYAQGTLSLALPAAASLPKPSAALSNHLNTAPSSPDQSRDREEDDPAIAELSSLAA